MGNQHQNRQRNGNLKIFHGICFDSHLGPWAFEISMGVPRPIYFLLSSACLPLTSVCVTDKAIVL
jgi:hypothetical protein